MDFMQQLVSECIVTVYFLLLFIANLEMFKTPKFKYWHLMLNTLCVSFETSLHSEV